MSTTENNRDAGADNDARLIAECVAARQPIPPEIVRRVQERAERARQEVRATHGVQEIGVQIIRELRGEMSQS
jgi:hypothetical protein